MNYLASQHIIHRDLAARNILVSIDSMREAKIKISDFGLSRKVDEDDIYVSLNRSQFPLRWTAVEIFQMVKAKETPRFSTKSDVWSFGKATFLVMVKGSRVGKYLSLDKFHIMDYQILRLFRC